MIATDADGTKADVTKDATFVSSNENIAVVDAKGAVKAFQKELLP